MRRGPRTRPTAKVAEPGPPHDITLSSASAEHYTPADIVEAARKLLGGIELDPASSRIANAIVGAERIFAKATNGLAQPWSGTVFLNPPGGKLGNESSQLLWWRKLVRHWLAREVRAAVFVAFNMELLRSSQTVVDGQSFSALKFPFCIPHRRIRFLKPAGGSLVRGASPVRPNAIIYLPERHKWTAQGRRFAQAFGVFGECVVPNDCAWGHARSKTI